MERLRAVPRLCESYTGICFTTEEKAHNFMKTTTILVSQSLKNVTRIDVHFTSF
jgi:hypothetical protein